MAADRRVHRSNGRAGAPRLTSAAALGPMLVVLLMVTAAVSSCTADESGLGPPSTTATTTGESSTAAQVGRATPTADDPLQSELDTWVRHPGEVGVTAALVAPDGRWSGAAGVDAAAEPLVPESAMGIGSVTKTFTAAQVLLLAEEGLVDLDAPITDYLDLPFDTQGATVQQLLSMRSGLPNATGPVFEAASTDLNQTWPTDAWYRLADTDEIGQVRVVGNPRYNNLNYVALTDLIETVTGHSYAAVLRADLIGPAELQRIWVQAEETPEPPVALGVDNPQLHVVDPDGPWLPSRAISSAAAGAGSLAADAPTLATWGATLYTGELLAPEHLAQMTTAPDDGDYGLGTGISTDSRGAPIVGHSGDIFAYSSTLLVCPDDQVAVAVLSPQASARTLTALAERLRYAWTD